MIDCKVAQLRTNLIFVNYSKWRRIVVWVWVYEGFDFIGM